MSTNKVYGDAPNEIPLEELPTRWDYADPAYAHGIPETFPSTSPCIRSSALPKWRRTCMAQEYGRYFGMPTCCLRGGCLTGPSHSGVELHGFLSYLVKCNLEGREYNVFGYKGKQVRDNIHSDDVARFMHAVLSAPRCGEVYNLGGGKDNSCSILEAFELVEDYRQRKVTLRGPEPHRRSHLLLQRFAQDEAAIPFLDPHLFAAANHRANSPGLARAASDFPCRGRCRRPA